MTDRRFHDIVIESQSMIGPQGEYHTAVCKTCSQQHRVNTDEFDIADLYKLVRDGNNLTTEQVNALDRKDNYKEILAYVAEMRAWNCCHEGEEPIDGFPDEPNSSKISFGQS